MKGAPLTNTPEEELYSHDIRKPTLLPYYYYYYSTTTTTTTTTTRTFRALVSFIDKPTAVP